MAVSPLSPLSSSTVECTSCWPRTAVAVWEREVRLTVRQEEEKTAPAARERVDVQPVSVAEFGDYVAYCHSNSDEMFKYQYMV